MGYVPQSRNTETGRDEIPLTIRRKIRARIAEIFRRGNFATIAAFANHLGISIGTVEKWFQKGDQVPQLVHARELAIKCNESLDWLVFTGIQQKTIPTDADLQEQLMSGLTSYLSDQGYKYDDIEQYLYSHKSLSGYFASLVAPHFGEWKVSHIIEQYLSQYRRFLDNREKVLPPKIPMLSESDAKLYGVAQNVFNKRLIEGINKEKKLRAPKRLKKRASPKRPK